MEAHTSQHDLSIAGMTCASCVRHIEKALTAVPGVESASVNLVTKHAHVVGSDAVGAQTLVEAVTRAGYGAQPIHASHAHVHEDAGDATVGRDTVIAALLTLPLLVAGMAHGALPWIEAPTGRWLQLVLATAVVGWAGRRFFRRALTALRRGSADMDTLVALGVGAAWLYSAAAVVAPRVFPHAEHGMVPHVYFEAAAVIVTFILTGKYLEARSRTRLTEAVRKLVGLQPRTARRRRGAADEEVAVESLAVDDLVVTRPGERVAADAEVVEGTSAVDESMLTGESIPVDKTAGASIYAGTINRGAPLVARVTRVAGESALARIAAAVRDAQGARAPIARLADVVSGYFVPAVLVIAVLTLAVWWWIDPSVTGFSVALERFVAVLIVACPCALGLATPAAVAVATGRGAELGILIKGGEVLETASRVNTALIDKTGTLTRGRPELTDLVTSSPTSETELLWLAASAERDSEHPIARALVEAASARGVVLTPATEVRVAVGFGVGATVDGKRVNVGSAAWVESLGLDTRPLADQAERRARMGRTVIFVTVDDRVAGVLAVADPVRASSRAAVDALRADGIDVVMVSGDRETTARAIAADLGIERVFAGVLPVDKARVVAEERGRGRLVAMVGDGINDAPALAAAEVGVAVAGSTDIATATADIVLTGEGVGQLPRALDLARAALRTIRQNLFWAFVYNVMAIPIAAGALYVWTGWQLSPVLASAAMSLSSVSVIANSLRLRRFGRVRG